MPFGEYNLNFQYKNKIHKLEKENSHLKKVKKVNMSYIGNKLKIEGL